MKTLPTESGKNCNRLICPGAVEKSTAIKHSRIDDARGYAHTAQQRLRRFSGELADVNWKSELSIDIGGFATFADYFFDGLISDWVVQSRIRDSIQRVSSVKTQVHNLLTNLNNEMQLTENEKGFLLKEKLALLENAE